MCGGAGMDMKTSSTIGFERAHNPALAIVDEDQFVEGAIARLGPQPPNFERIVAMNRGPLLRTGVEIPALYPEQLERKRDEGAMLIDVRTDLQFDDVHIAGSICIPSFSSGFGSKLAWLVDPDREVVFIGRDDADGRRAARLALAVGVRNFAGLLAGGMTNWRQERRPAEETERLHVDGLAERLAADPAMQVLDVRERGEWEMGHIPGSVWTPWHDILEIPAGLDPERPIAVICAAGVRAATAASLLRHHGARSVIHVVYGGVPRYGQLGQPLESVPPAPAGVPA
jgi:rhodanese-related sulfurtransferase